MQIETDSPEIELTRTLSLELLLSDHRADCEAPCKVVCPGGLDIPAMNRLYDKDRFDEALTLLRDTLVIPATLCFICPAPCEKICRKGSINTAVPIRELKKELVSRTDLQKVAKPPQNGMSVAVIGSDPLGLSAAYRLRKLGYRVRVFEKSGDVLFPHIQTDKVDRTALKGVVELEVSVLTNMGVEFVMSDERDRLHELEELDGVIAAVCEAPSPKWLVPSAKTKQPARLVLEGCKLADALHASLSVVDGTATTVTTTFNSTFGRLSEAEVASLGTELPTQQVASGCLYCDCDKKTTCKLRLYATRYGIKSSRYGASSVFEALHRQRINGSMWFEPAKCIRCGLCVYNSDNGFTFRDRGFVMQVVLPPENVGNVKEELADLCPTGGIWKDAP
ncbi:hypothetical protein FACS1894199_17350 [Bacteroidia bacterium]|nr:hypothetical protein FACS1894199_17350 [Bacteroidia bacterium]